MDGGLTTRLRRLGTERAPRTLVPAVLAAGGLGDEYATVDTALGTLSVAWSSRGISAVMRTDDATVFEDWFTAHVGRPLRRADALPARLRTALVDTVDGRRHGVLHFDLRGRSPFEQDVLTTALSIPRGEVRPYGWVAREIGRPRAVRAVGTALGRNPVPFLIPCHRVVRSDGTIGDYGAGGPDAKRAVLRMEGVEARELERLARAGVRLVGSTSTRIFCHPTCRHARRVTEPRRVGFRAEAEALAAGYRPCRICRPAAVAA